MSEVCEICGQRTATPAAQRESDANPFSWIVPKEYAGMCFKDIEHWRLGYERTLARADRSEAEFCACKALLIAAQKRAEEAEAGRAAWKDACRKTERERDSNMEAVRSAALREAAAALRKRHGCTGDCGDVDVVRALAALPVEPARRQPELPEWHTQMECSNIRDCPIHQEDEAPAAGCPEEER